MSDLVEIVLTGLQGFSALGLGVLLMALGVKIVWDWGHQ